MNPHPSPALDLPEPCGYPQATPWSLVLSEAKQPSESACAALESLCRAYWYPVYAFLRRRGAPHHEAEETTRGFFAGLPHTGDTGSADPERGHFRTFLLAAVSHHITDARRRVGTGPRGGGRAPQPLVLHGADEKFAREPVDPGLTPEEAFDHDWAMTTIELAIATLRAEYAALRSGALVDALGPYVWGGSMPPPQADAAAELGMTEHAFTAAVHRLRHRLRDHLRTLVAATVADPAQADGELRFLLAVVRRRPVAA